MTRRVLGAFASGLLCCALGHAQVPAPPPVVLKGYDPVAYFTLNKAVKGAADISFDFDEGRYLFSSAQHRQAFRESPDRYAPQFAGFCTAGLAKGMRVEANPEVFVVANGKLYTFASLKAKEAALGDPTTFARAAKNFHDRK